MFPRKGSSCQLFFTVLALLFFIPIHANAQLGSRATQEWIQELERPQRIAGLKVDEVVSLLKVKPGDIVADIGAGAGAFSFPLAKAVAPSGKVYAVDIDAGLLDYIARKAKNENVENIQTVKGEFSDPKIPGRDVDLGFINDVLHHIENRRAYLQALASYIKPTGRIAIIDNNRDDPKTPHRNSPEMLLSKEDVNAWMAAAGFRLGQEFDLFGSRKWFIVYARQ
jgi:2-polyprenyl-3-methyl-5-hydroxy-6-metoxy-1,4-benzoquinol methylase